MTSSSDDAVPRALDTMLLVYSLLREHPASETCEQHLRAHSGWMTTPLVLLEANSVLTKVYGVDRDTAAEKIVAFAAGPVAICHLDQSLAVTAITRAAALSLDLNDAILLCAAESCGVLRLSTDDRKLIRVCSSLGFTADTPIDDALRALMRDWEVGRLPERGLPRILHQVHRWLLPKAAALADDFWSHTGAGSHLP